MASPDVPMIAWRAGTGQCQPGPRSPCICNTMMARIDFRGPLSQRPGPVRRFPKAGMDSQAGALASGAPATLPGLRRRGRPRSAQAEQAVLAAALDLIAERGPEGLGIEQVAARAGVGKATIYRRWRGKEDMLLDAIGSLGSDIPVPQGRSVRADLVALLDAFCREAADPRRA